jgi:hypothetical protein
MSTVASRTFKSTPGRDALDTWTAIVDLLTKGTAGAARTELLAVGGVAASVIADQAPKDGAITVTCDGPRTRIYCLYDEDALDGGENEAALGYDPLKGDWKVSLPCLADDLAWVQAALKKHSDRITAREIDEAVVKEASSAETAAASDLTLDPKGFLRS